MYNKDENRVYLELQSYCENKLGLKILKATQINRGWMNLKWKIETDQGAFLLKEFNAERYNIDDIRCIRVALELQQQLHKQGVACPKLLTHDGQVMHVTNNSRSFAIMSFCQGQLIKPGEVNEEQMYHLGCQTGKMHRLLNHESITEKRTPQFIPPSKEVRMSYWTNLFKEVERDSKQALLSSVELQIKATEAIDLTVFNKCEEGIAHRDLWVDNILFTNNELSAILDFDRLRYDYPELDVARAILSCSLLNNQFQLDNAIAFLRGYRTECTFPRGSLVRAFLLLWYLESTWWINKQMDQHSVPTRFAEEMIWLSKSQSELKEMFAGI